MNVINCNFAEILAENLSVSLVDRDSHKTENCCFSFVVFFLQNLQIKSFDKEIFDWYARI